MAGVLLPGVIIVGLCAIPYLDTNPSGIGYYSWKERPFANAIFMLGVIMWFALIFIGVYCRGPNYFWYWPWESWMIHKPPPPPMWIFPMWAGFLSIGGYTVLGMGAPRFFKNEIPWGKAFAGVCGVYLVAALGLKGKAGIGT